MHSLPVNGPDHGNHYVWKGSRQPRCNSIRTPSLLTPPDCRFRTLYFWEILNLTQARLMNRHWWIGWWVSSPFNHQFFVSPNINRISCWSCYDTFTLEALGIFPFVIRLSHFHCFLLEGIDDSFSSSLTVTIFLHFFALGRCLLLDTHHNSLLIAAALTWSQWLKRVGWP